jgi:hypothetical protein
MYRTYSHLVRASGNNGKTTTIEGDVCSGSVGVSMKRLSSVKF